MALIRSDPPNLFVGVGIGFVNEAISTLGVILDDFLQRVKLQLLQLRTLELLQKYQRQGSQMISVKLTSSATRTYPSGRIARPSFSPR